jgi:hypothetical protein
VRAVHCFEGSDLNYASIEGMSITSTAFMRVLKTADQHREAIVLVHSHPLGLPHFSWQDDRVEPDFFQAAFTRIADVPAHGSLIFTQPDAFVGRAWVPDGSNLLLSDVCVIGSRWRFLTAATDDSPPSDLFDRQIRAFGSDVQRVLGHLHIGVVGAGSTGSATIEQLTRLGVGMLTVIEDQTFERSNVNRVYNSGVADDSIPKVDIVRRAVSTTGLGTKLRIISARVTEEQAARALRSCDLILGCTDDNWGRAVLDALALRYLIPVIDMAVKVITEAGKVVEAVGRVSYQVTGGEPLQRRTTTLLYGTRARPATILRYAKDIPAGDYEIQIWVKISRPWIKG